MTRSVSPAESGKTQHKTSEALLTEAPPDEKEDMDRTRLPSKKKSAQNEDAVSEERSAHRARRAMPQGELPEIEVLNRVDAFQTRVLEETDTAAVLVETFGGRPGQPVSVPKRNQEGLVATDVPGYIAFSPIPESVHLMPETMAGIAERYFETFPLAPRVTISIIRGGGVRGSRTYLNSFPGAVPAGKRFNNTAK